jgi:hypothetical protein
MVNSRSTGHEIHSKELKYLDSEKKRRIPAKEGFYCVKKTEEHYDRQSKLNQLDLIENNTSTEKQQIDGEAQKAVEFKAKVLFELEQVISEIEQFKQSYK